MNSAAGGSGRTQTWFSALADSKPLPVHMQSLILTPPTEEPVTLAEAKAAARISGTQFDTHIPGLITAARRVAEQETNRQFMEQVVRFELEDWPAADDVFKVYRPTSVAVQQWNGTTFVELDAAAFATANTRRGFVLVPALNSNWPTLPEVAAGPRVYVDATVGVADAADVDECVKLYIKAVVARWLRNPESATLQQLQPAPDLGSLLDPVRLYL